MVLADETPARCQIKNSPGEFLPWIGLALVIGLALDGQSTLNTTICGPFLRIPDTDRCRCIRGQAGEHPLDAVWGALVANLAAYFLQYWFTYGSVPLWKGC